MANLSKGAKGKPVALLQKALNKKGAKPKLKEDSSFGPLTDAAVRAYQKKKKMKADGVVGPLTGFSMGISPRPKSLDWPFPDLEKTAKFFENIDDEVSGDMKKYFEVLKTAIKEGDALKKILIARAKMMDERKTIVVKFFAAEYKKLNEIRVFEKASASSTSMDEILKIHEKARAAHKGLSGKDYDKVQAVWTKFYDTVEDIKKFQDGVNALKPKLEK